MAPYIKLSSQHIWEWQCWQIDRQGVVNMRKPALDPSDIVKSILDLSIGNLLDRTLTSRPLQSKQKHCPARNAAATCRPSDANVIGGTPVIPPRATDQSSFPVAASSAKSEPPDLPKTSLPAA
jgi:hypothetical protein